MRANRRAAMLGPAALAALVCVSPGAFASGADLELLMFETPGCPWCERWTEEIGGAYPNTTEGARAPLRRVWLHDGAPEGVSLERPVRYSPTFVLVRTGREIGRIEGYPGQDFFWPLLGELLEKTEGESG